jgi:excisionase family DNA binding protein
MDKLLLRPLEVAELLGIGRSKTYELIGAGLIPSVRIGTSVRVPVESLRAWISKQTDDAARIELSTRLDGR